MNKNKYKKQIEFEKKLLKADEKAKKEKEMQLKEMQALVKSLGGWQVDRAMTNIDIEVLNSKDKLSPNVKIIHLERKDI